MKIASSPEGMGYSKLEEGWPGSEAEGGERGLPSDCSHGDELDQKEVSPDSKPSMKKGGIGTATQAW